MNTILELENISVSYDNTVIVNQVSFSLQRGDIGCLLGPSGCGKTTILRSIAGFEPLSGGEIKLADRVVSRADLTTPPEKRGIGMVFQDFALFPHLSIAQNIAFGIRKQKNTAQKKRVTELLSLIGLPDYGQRYPHELSGGQQQRVALVRALAPKPHLLLMDEPFGSQDVEIRETLAAEVRNILLQENITAMLVTHDQNEAFVMADEIGVIHKGQLVQWDKGYDLYHQPKTHFVADFVGQGKFIHGKVISENQVDTALGVIHGEVPSNYPIGSSIDLLIRPDDIQHDDGSPQQVTVKERSFRGAQFLYTLTLNNDETIQALIPSHHDHSVGDDIGIVLEMDHIVAFPR